MRHLWEAARLGIGESDLDRMEFRRMSPLEAIEGFRWSRMFERQPLVMPKPIRQALYIIREYVNRGLGSPVRENWSVMCTIC